MLTLQKALTTAQNEKVRVFRNGMWQYVTNESAVAEAQKALDDYTAQQKEQADVAAIESQITALQSNSDSWEQYVSDYSDLLTKLENEATLGTTYENFLSGLGITSAQSFIAALAKLAGTQSSVSKQLSGYASGSDSIDTSGVYRFNEQGYELSIPNNINYAPKGTGIIPHTLASNLMEIGKYNLDGLTTHVSNASNISSNKDNSTHIVIQSLSVKSDNANDFVKQLKNLSIVK